MNHFYNLNWKCTQNKSDFRHNSSEKTLPIKVQIKYVLLTFCPEPVELHAFDVAFRTKAASDNISTEVAHNIWCIILVCSKWPKLISGIFVFIFIFSLPSTNDCVMCQCQLRLLPTFNSRRDQRQPTDTFCLNICSHQGRNELQYTILSFRSCALLMSRFFYVHHRRRPAATTKPNLL